VSSVTELEVLVRAVRTAIEETHAEYAQMPFFVRPLVKRGFVKRTGHDMEGWRRLLAQSTPTIAPDLERLAAHYDGAPERAKRGMVKPDELREVERRSQARAQAARALATYLERKADRVL
jgi:hypothetical protein